VRERVLVHQAKWMRKVSMSREGGEGYGQGQQQGGEPTGEDEGGARGERRATVIAFAKPMAAL
jgi:hypothetical protein